MNIQSMSTRYFAPTVCFLLLGFQQIARGAFPNAWQIADSGTTPGSVASYRTNLLSSQSTTATNLSFRFTVNARLADDFGGAESLGFFYSTGTNRFGVSFDHDANGNLVVLCRPMAELR
jgi:hypothetical protein